MLTNFKSERDNGLANNVINNIALLRLTL